MEVGKHEECRTRCYLLRFEQQRAHLGELDQQMHLIWAFQAMISYLNPKLASDLSNQLSGHGVQSREKHANRPFAA